MRYAFTTLAYPDLKLPEVIERFKRFGFDALELRVADDGIHLKPSYPIEKSVKEIIGDVKVSDLAGYAKFSSPDDLERERNIKLAETLILMAHDLGAGGVRVYAGQFKDSPEDAIKRVRMSLNGLAEFAEKNNVVLMIETHDEIAKLSFLLRLIEGLDERIGLVYDPANMIFAGERHEDVFPKIYTRVRHVHIKDFVVKDGKRLFVRPGQGVVPIKEIVRDLMKVGYQGYISVEWEKMWNRDIEDADVVLPLYLEYLKRCEG